MIDFTKDFTKAELAQLEAVVEQMVQDEGREPAKNTGKFFSAVGFVFSVLGALGVSYDADLPTLTTAAIVVIAAILGAGIPAVQAGITRGKVFSPVTVLAIIRGLSNAAVEGEKVVNHDPSVIPHA